MYKTKCCGSFCSPNILPELLTSWKCFHAKFPPCSSNWLDTLLNFICPIVAVSVIFGSLMDFMWMFHFAHLHGSPGPHATSNRGCFRPVVCSKTLKTTATIGRYNYIIYIFNEVDWL